MSRVRTNTTQHNSEIAIEAFNQLFPDRKINTVKHIPKKNKEPKK